MHVCCRAPHGARGLKFKIVTSSAMDLSSRPAWGAWIEMTAMWRSCTRARSRPAWGAWIEIASKPAISVSKFSRAPHGARGLKSEPRTWRQCWRCRAPHGARGLKSLPGYPDGDLQASRPAWGAWIEMQRYPGLIRDLRMSRPAWGAWIEILEGFGSVFFRGSRPAWGAWIEMRPFGTCTGPGAGRAPHGARGLKLGQKISNATKATSHPIKR